MQLYHCWAMYKTIKLSMTNIIVITIIAWKINVDNNNCDDNKKMTRRSSIKAGVLNNFVF